MLTFPTKARTGNDGTLHLAIPTGLPDVDVDFLIAIDVVHEPLNQGQELSQEWPAGYFEEYFGALGMRGFVRHDQGLAEERESLR